MKAVSPLKKKKKKSSSLKSKMPNFSYWSFWIVDASKNYALAIHMFAVVISISCKNAHKLEVQLIPSRNQEKKVFYGKIKE